MKQVTSYTHPPLTAQDPDTKPGDYYVSVLDSGRYALALGPFRDDHAGALERVAEVRVYCQEQTAKAAWWAFGTCRLDSADDNPHGKLNDALEVTV